MVAESDRALVAPRHVLLGEAGLAMFVVDTPDALDRLLFLKRSDDIEIRLPALSVEQAAAWTRTLRRDVRACGCTEAAVCLLGALALALVGLVAGWLGIVAWTVETGMIMLVALVLAPVIGKLYGLRTARRRLQKAVRRLRKEIQ